MFELWARRRELAALADEKLLDGLSQFSRQDRRILVEVLLHLSEVGRRELHVAAGARSLFDYCTRLLGWSESEAGRRIAVARAMERFPVICGLLRSGKAHSGGLSQVAALLTEENHAGLLERICGQSRRSIEALVAELRPPPQPREVVRALGRRGPRPEQPVNGTRTPASAAEPGTVAPRAQQADSTPPGDREPPLADNSPATSGTPTGGSGSAIPEARYEMRFSVGEGFLANVERARQLLSGKFPRGASTEQLFATVLEAFLEREAPLVRARRRQARNGARAALLSSISARANNGLAGVNLRRPTPGDAHARSRSSSGMPFICATAAAALTSPHRELGASRAGISNWITSSRSVEVASTRFRTCACGVVRTTYTRPESCLVRSAWRSTCRPPPGAENRATEVGVWYEQV